jgi:hypothetical protein
MDPTIQDHETRIKALETAVADLTAKTTIVRKVRQVVIEKENGTTTVKVRVLRKLPSGATEETWEEASPSAVLIGDNLLDEVKKD